MTAYCAASIFSAGSFGGSAITLVMTSCGCGNRSAALAPMELADLGLDAAPIGEAVKARAFDRSEGDRRQERQALHHQHGRRKY